jgi:hypothetical protein
MALVKRAGYARAKPAPTEGLLFAVGGGFGAGFTLGMLFTLRLAMLLSGGFTLGMLFALGLRVFFTLAMFTFALGMFFTLRAMMLEGIPIAAAIVQIVFGGAGVVRAILTTRLVARQVIATGGQQRQHE